MFILGERTVHISWFSSCWIAWRLVHTAHSPSGLTLSLCNKQSTDMTIKICQDNGGYCIWKSMQKTPKRKPSKSEVIGEMLDFMQGLFSWWEVQGFWRWKLNLCLRNHGRLWLLSTVPCCEPWYYFQIMPEHPCKCKSQSCQRAALREPEYHWWDRNWTAINVRVGLGLPSAALEINREMHA